jgi:hypothetical protein
VPCICQFFGIAIYMYWSEHGVPHIHAEYAEYKASIDFRTGQVLDGSIPLKQLKLVHKWIKLHLDELEVNWRLCRNMKQPMRIGPLR